MILIGSAALDFPDDQSAFKRDFDIIGTPAEKKLFVNSGLRIDWHDSNSLNNASVEDRFSDGEVIIHGITMKKCSVRGLAAIKRSHLWRNYFFEKHMPIYNMRLKEHLSPLDAAWVAERAQLTKIKERITAPSLAVSNDDFFTAAVDRKYNHDLLHELFAFGDRPIFEDMKRDLSKATCHKDLWQAFPHEKKILCVVEETMVTAAERYMIPNDWKFMEKRAYVRAMGKLCTTMTSGWFRDFMLDNYMEIYYAFNKAPFNQVRNKLDEIAL
jgi:hypothetical protein